MNNKSVTGTRRYMNDYSFTSLLTAHSKQGLTATQRAMIGDRMEDGGFGSGYGIDSFTWSR